MQDNITNNLMTKKGLSLKFNISLRSIDRLIDKGLPYIKIGGLYRFNYEEVYDWLKKKEEVVL